MSPTGPYYASSATAGADWTNVANATGIANGSFAYNSNVGITGHIPSQLVTSGHSFNLPSLAVIDGIMLEALVLSGFSTDYAIGIQTGSKASSSTPNFGRVWPTTAAWVTWGGTTSLWGRGDWSAADINSTSFGASLSAYPGHANDTIDIDSVRITVYWHWPPANVMKRYIFKIFNSAGTYLGLLPQPKNDLKFTQDINTAGTQIQIECAVSPDTAVLQVDTLGDEAGNTLTDEAGNILMREAAIPICALGNAPYDALIKDGNKIEISEVSYYNPAGKIVFLGRIERWEGSFGSTSSGSGSDDHIVITVYSHGQDLDNYLVRGYPYTYTTDVSQPTQNTSGVIIYSSSIGSWNYYGQTWQATLNNLGAILLMFNGTADITINVYDSASMINLLGTVTQHVSVGSATVVLIPFATPIVTSIGSTYFFTVTCSTTVTQNITIYFNNTNPYANGIMYNSNYGGGAGGGAWTPYSPLSDLYFVTYSGTGSTNGVFTGLDPTTGILAPVVADYTQHGGIIYTTASNIGATGLTLSYTFNTQTILEAIQQMLTLCPNGFYWYVDIATNILYFKQANTTPDIIFTKNKHLNQITFIATIENTKNTAYFSGGVPAGQTQNVYALKSDTSSSQAFGPRLDRLSDNHVTDITTARQVAYADVQTYKGENFQTSVTVVDRTMDTTLLRVGMVAGFNGFGTFFDNMNLLVVRIDYTPEEVTLTLGALPKRLPNRLELTIRNLLALQTIANPSSPS